jgi:hypothetical protein
MSNGKMLADIRPDASGGEKAGKFMSRGYPSAGAKPKDEVVAAFSKQHNLLCSFYL